MVFLLNILCKALLTRKCLLNNLKNILPIFVFTFNENGGLYQIIFLSLSGCYVLIYCMVVLVR